MWSRPLMLRASKVSNRAFLLSTAPQISFITPLALRSSLHYSNRATARKVTPAALQRQSNALQKQLQRVKELQKKAKKNSVSQKKAIAQKKTAVQKKAAQKKAIAQRKAAQKKLALEKSKKRAAADKARKQRASVKRAKKLAQTRAKKQRDAERRRRLLAAERQKKAAAQVREKAARARVARQKKEASEAAKKVAMARLKKENELLRQFPDPQKPKRPAGAYQLFVSDVYHQNSDNVDTRSVFKSAPSQWQSLPTAQKQQYAQRASAERERYRSAMARYNNSDLRQKWVATAAQLKEQRPPSSGYAVFVSQQYRNHKQANEGGSASLKRLAAAWNSLNADEKMKYNSAAKQKYFQWKAKVESFN